MLCNLLVLRSGQFLKLSICVCLLLLELARGFCELRTIFCALLNELLDFVLFRGNCIVVLL